MNERQAPFRYRLAPLLKRDVWERDRLQAELQRVTESFERSDGLHRAALQRVADAETRMRDLQQPDQTFSPDACRMLQLHLRHEYAASALRRQEMHDAEQLLDRVRTQFESKRIAVKTLEKHRERQAEASTTTQVRLTFRQADDAWLSRQAGKGSR